jgi:hypothetical protein
MGWAKKFRYSNLNNIVCLVGNKYYYIAHVVANQQLDENLLASADKVSFQSYAIVGLETSLGHTSADVEVEAALVHRTVKSSAFQSVVGYLVPSNVVGLGTGLGEPVALSLRSVDSAKDSFSSYCLEL